MHEYKLGKNFWSSFSTLFFLSFFCFCFVFRLSSFSPSRPTFYIIVLCLFRLVFLQTIFFISFYLFFLLPPDSSSSSPSSTTLPLLSTFTHFRLNPLFFSRTTFLQSPLPYLPPMGIGASEACPELPLPQVPPPTASLRLLSLSRDGRGRSCDTSGLGFSPKLVSIISLAHRLPLAPSHSPAFCLYSIAIHSSLFSFLIPFSFSSSTTTTITSTSLRHCSFSYFFFSLFLFSFLHFPYRIPLFLRFYFYFVSSFSTSSFASSSFSIAFVFLLLLGSTGPRCFLSLGAEAAT